MRVMTQDAYGGSNANQHSEPAEDLRRKEGRNQAERIRVETKKNQHNGQNGPILPNSRAGHTNSNEKKGNQPVQNGQG